MQFVPSQNIDELFVQLMDQPPGEQQDRLRELADSGDVGDNVRERLQALLEADSCVREELWLEHSPLISGERHPSEHLGDTETYPLGDTASFDRKTLETGGGAIPAKISKYRLQRLLGEGGFGVVYEAIDTVQGITVALKVPRDKLTTDAQKDSFLKEARTICRIQQLNRHANIVEIHNADISDDGQPFIAMEYVKGTDFRAKLKAHRGGMDIDEATRILGPVASAMAWAHENERNIVHRDLKPANILIGEDGSPKVTDFGLAIRDDQPRAAGEFAGTRAYMAPEQVRREAHLYGSTDVWALGVMLYESLTGKRPFTGAGSATEQAILSGKFKRLREARSDVPPRLESLCNRCLSLDPVDRPTAREFAQTLAPKKKRPAAILAIAAFGAVLIALAAAGVWMRYNHRGVDELATPGEPYSLLRREARVVSTNYDEVIVSQAKTGGPISVTSESMTMLQVDETQRRQFTLEIAFRKAIWAGETGVFWGRLPVVYNNRKCWVANAVMLRCYTDETGDRIEATCHRWRFDPISEGRYEVRELAPIATAHSKKWLRPEVNAGIIQVAIERDALEDSLLSCRWQKRRLEFDRPPDFGSHSGGMGFINLNGASVLGRAEIIFPVEKDANP